MATGINEVTVEEIKARVDLADLISSYGIAVKTAGASKKACCPFHHEKTPSFNINESKGFYHCFGCGKSGDAIRFVMEYEGLSFVEAVRKLADQCGVVIEERVDPAAGRRKRLYSLLAELSQFYHRCLKQTKEGSLARDYLQERALGDKIQADYLIGYAPVGATTILKWGAKYGYTAEELETAGVVKAPTRPGDRGYHRFGGRLMFSIRDKQGRVVGFSGRQLVASKNSGKYVNSPETPVFKKSNILYGFDKAAAEITRATNREAIVCEGQIDCIRLQTSGFPNSVAGQGTAFTDEHVKMLKRVADQVVLVYDDDLAGHKATIKSARLCLAAELPVRVVSLPGGDDPDSFLRTHSAEDFRRMLAEAESIMSFQVRTERAKEVNPDSVDAVNRISREVLSTIAQCASAILRATMLDEAAKFLGLPRIALQEELEKIKASSSIAATKIRPTEQPVAQTPDGFADDEELSQEVNADDTPFIGEDAATYLSPPEKELALCEFLLAHEDSPDVKAIDAIVGEFLPKRIFVHDFTLRFVDVWRQSVISGEDFLAPWRDALDERARGWFDRLLLREGRSLASNLRPTEIAEDFVRILWSEHLTRIRGSLPVNGSKDADARRMNITLDLKRLNSVKWSNLKEMVRDWMRGE